MTERVLKFTQVEEVGKLSAGELAEVAADAAQIHTLVMNEFSRRNAELAESQRVAAGLKPGGVATPPKGGGAKRGRPSKKDLAALESAKEDEATDDGDDDSDEVSVALDA